MVAKKPPKDPIQADSSEALLREASEQLRSLSVRLDQIAFTKAKSHRPLSDAGLTIRERRIEQGLTLKDLASLADISVATLQKIETGDLSVSCRILTAVASALGMRLWIG